VACSTSTRVTPIQSDWAASAVEKPLDLAVYLMRKRWDRAAIEGALDEGTERTIYLPRPRRFICCTGPRGLMQTGRFNFVPTSTISIKPSLSRSRKNYKPLRPWV